MHDLEDADHAGSKAPFPALLPLDEHNQQLQQNTHPRDWQNPVPSGRYNLVVIGGGTAGLVTAAGAAGLGAKVALIERGLLGGDCLNVGCVPSKALIRCARAAAEVRDAHKYGVHTSPPEVDFSAVMERMRALRASMSAHDSAARFRELGVDVYLGEARFAGRHEVEVGGQTLRFARAAVATGARAKTPSIEGLEAAGYLTNETVFSLTELPPRLAVLGAGPIGCELAQAFARLGSRVTLIASTPHVLPREDADATKLVEAAMLREGVDIICGGNTRAVSRDGNEKVLQVACDGHTREIRVEQMLIAVGRTPNVESLNLEAAGVACDGEKGIQVNDYLQTSNPHIYAAGDVASRYQFTHAADAMARIVIRNALFFGREKVSGLTMPWCTYTDPEVAHVGLYEAEAKQRGVAVTTITIPMSEVDRARLDGEEDGFLRVHLKKGSDQILGATLVSRHAGETISEITATMTAGKGLGALAKTIHCYPTQAEAIKKAADAYNRARLTPRAKRVFEVLLAWRR